MPEPGEALDRRAQQVDEEPAIIVVAHDVGAGVAPVGNVVERAGVFDVERSQYEPILRKPSAKNKT